MMPEAWEACGGVGLPSGPLISRRLAAGYYRVKSDSWWDRVARPCHEAYRLTLEADFMDTEADAKYALANAPEPRWYEGIR